ncbi:MAG TPA: hypothetical protein VMV92_01080 [Streptosporangiaceae bacterium]|nr:hypothetical protein [Streptosporangiaceae bacterium]
MSDLVTATARPRWAAQLATWAATACWAVGGYLVFVGVLFAVTAQQVTWARPRHGYGRPGRRTTSAGRSAPPWSSPPG